MVPKHYGIRYHKYDCFRAVLFRMVPKLNISEDLLASCFRAVLFRMVPKLQSQRRLSLVCFRAVLFRMVPKHIESAKSGTACFRAVLFRMVLMIFLSMKINQNFSENVFQRFSKIFFYGKIESEFI